MKSNIFKYVAALAFVAIAAFLRVRFNEELELRLLFVPFYLPVLASTCLGGWKHGCFATILSATALHYLSASSRFPSIGFDIENPARLVVFFSGCAILIGLIEGQRMARRSAETLVKRLQAQIADQQETENRLAASEERYRSLFENNLDAVFTMDLDGFFTTANPSALKLCGYTIAELRQMRFTAICPPDQHEEAMRHFQLAVQGNPEPFFESRLTTKDGRCVDLFLTGGPIKIGGNVAGVFAIVADISERKRFQTRLAAFSQVGQRLSSVTSPIAAGRIIGDVAEELFGWDSFSLNLHSQESEQTDYVLNVDTFHGEKTEILPFLSAPGIPSLAARVMANGAELAVNPCRRNHTTIPFMESVAQSASIMSVPIHDKEKVIGVMSVSNRQPGVYNEQDLNTLLALADYCGGALQRIRVEEMLHRNEQEYRALFDSDGTGKCEVDSEGRCVLRANPKLCELTGYAEEELIGKVFLEITHPEDREISRQNFEKLIRGEINEYRMEKRCDRKDKSVFWADTTVTLVRDAKGKPSRAIATFIDISDRVHAETALRESENRFTSFMQHLSASAWMKDLQGRYVYVNAACAKFTGKTPSIMVGKTDHELFPKNTAREFVMNDRRVVNSRKAIQTVEAFVTENELHYSAVSKFPILDKHGEAAFVAGIGIDITDRKTAEEELAISNRRLSLIAQVTSAVVGDESLAEQMRNVAETVRAAYGVKACIIRELEGEEMTLLACAGVDPTTLPPRLPKNGRIFQEIFNRRCPLFIPDLQTFTADPFNSAVPRVIAMGFVSYAGAPLMVNDKIIGILGFFHDQPMADLGATDLQHLQVIANHIAVAIANNHLYHEVTRQKSVLEEQIRERQQAEEAVQKMNAELEMRVAERTNQLQMANAELEAFAYSVSHDLRGPLRSIAGFSEVLKEDHGVHFDEEGQEYLERVLQGCREMDNLIDDMLHLSRLTRMDMKLQPVNLSLLAEGIIGRLREAQPQRSVDVIIAPGLIVPADSRLMRIALENILNNAWKFTARTGNAKIEFGTLSRPDGPVYYIRDNGAGFDMAFAGKLFGPFQRLHSTHEFPGHGIGLATVQRIISRHGGRTWATGEVDRGASLYFTLTS